MSGRKKEPGKHSQFDEELIIQKLWKGGRGRCADIGARDERGSNTYALWKKGWFCQFIDKDVNGLLKAYPVGSGNHEVVHATVTPENVNEILAPNLDLLSIDIDGDDYYVWKAVKQTPKIVIIETNPKKKSGVQELRHEGDYEGCSVETMTKLGKEKGYNLYGKTGVNLVFFR